MGFFVRWVGMAALLSSVGRAGGGGNVQSARRGGKRPLGPRLPAGVSTCWPSREPGASRYKTWVTRGLRQALPQRVATRGLRAGPSRLGTCAALLLWTLSVGGCLALRPSALGDRSLSMAGTSSGWLHRGAILPDRATALERARPGEATRAGVPRLLAALEHAAAEVEGAFPGARPLRIGDLSSPMGGRHSRHRSHRSGRDVDILYYLTGAAGVPVEPRGRVAFSRFGVAPDLETGEVVTFDDARNWHLVRTLLADPSIEVQWVFCSRGIKSRLLRHALALEPDRDLVARAAYVLAQPANAAPHDDHFHVRVFCTLEERALGCRDVAPFWPWLRARLDASEAGQSYDDARLLEILGAP